MDDQFTIRQPEYLESFKAFRDSESLLQIGNEVVKQISKKDGGLNCLDSMAGTGIVGRTMKETFNQIKIVFQDKSKKMLASNVYQDEVRVESDAMNTGLPGSSFDIIFCRGGLNNVGKMDYPSILGEYIRLLADDGIVILQDHFAKTQEEKEAINRVETEIATIEGRSDETYVPTILELEQLIKSANGKTLNEQFFDIRLSLKERFEAKRTTKPSLTNIKAILKNQTHIKYEESEDDISLVYPIATITFSKNSKITGLNFLEAEQQNGFFPSYISSERNVTSVQQAPREIFSSIVVANILPETIRYAELRKAILQYVSTQAQPGQFTFFEDRSLLPPDIDTNSLGYALLLENGLVTPETANKVFDSILEHRDHNGKIQVWLSKERENRLDHVVGANALYLAYLLGRESEVQSTEAWLMSTLDSGEYLQGSRYYHSPDSFLYFLSRLTTFSVMKEKLNERLEQRLRERVGRTEYPLDLAMRVIVADAIGTNNDLEKQKLLDLRGQNGACPIDALYKKGSEPVFYTNESVPTAFAIRALDA